MSQGYSYSHISRAVGLTKATISYHAKRLGLSRGYRTVVDWCAVQQYYDLGHSYRDCKAEFGFASNSWAKAVRAGRIKPRPNGRPLQDLLCDQKGIGRGAVRKRVLRAALLPYECAICRLGPQWLGKRLVLELDHINGIRDDHRLTNLRFLCPNCHSQTDTNGGRNCCRSRTHHSPVV